MKPFQFTLEPLRVLRGQKERAAQRRYVQALAACNLAERQLEDAATELMAGWKVLGEELCRGVDSNRLNRLHTWCKVLEIRRNERQAQADKVRQTAEQLFQEMTLASRDREALDKFRDKSRHAYERQAQREEQNMFDELAVQMSALPGPLQMTGATL